MNKQNKFAKYILVGLTLFTWVACDKDEAPVVDEPQIESLEVGRDNNGMVRPGGDLHIDAPILAPGGIANITLGIHPESGDGWTFEQVFTEGYEGLKNADFHEHIDVPAEATEGEYHLHLTVTDQAGQIAEVESHLEITAEADADSGH
ncbi:DUF4625 domain-containing protein [Parapedobacter sp.]